jgi:hypothetical protein
MEYDNPDCPFCGKQLTTTWDFSGEDELPEEFHCSDCDEFFPLTFDGEI